ncbi:MAG: hypothetical protein HZR80_12020 [Candidatus Heimdallarchaeota archaeon]
MVKILGLNIGGANTKYALLSVENNQLKLLTSGSEYFPFWKKLQSFPSFLAELKEKLKELHGNITQVVFVTTAELADCFQTKKEGIQSICDSVLEVFYSEGSNMPLILDVNGDYIPVDIASENWLSVAATNWVASAKYFAKDNVNAIVIDIGSTTTDIIPIFNGEIVAEGKNDLERLISKELVYVGLIRTNVVAIIQEIKLNNKIIPLASELFATSGDVYLILNMISEDEFTSDTADGKPADKKHAMVRLSHIICADTNQLAQGEIIAIAKQVKDKQLEQLSIALNVVADRYREKYSINPKFVLIGAGATTLGISLLRMNGIYEEVIANDILGDEKLNVFCAFAVAAIYQQLHMTK